MVRPQLVTLGDNVVDRYVDLGWMYPGGNTVNVAVHAARLGVRASYIGVVGTDDAGRCVLDSLRAEGVDDEHITVLDGPNATATVRVVDGNRVFGDGTVGVSRFAPTAEHLALIGAADMVHTGDCSMLEEHLPRLRKHARALSFDFSERPWEYIQQLAPLVDIAICSMPSDDSVEHRATAIAALGPRTVVVTRGAAGATLLTPEGFHHSPAGTGPVVDTLGAGDALAARLLTGLMTGEAPQSALDAATVYATVCCAEYGAFGHQTALATPITTADDVSTHEGAPT